MGVRNSWLPVDYTPIKLWSPEGGGATPPDNGGKVTEPQNPGSETVTQEQLQSAIDSVTARHKRALGKAASTAQSAVFSQIAELAELDDSNLDAESLAALIKGAKEKETATEKTSRELAKLQRENAALAQQRDEMVARDNASKLRAAIATTAGSKTNDADLLHTYLVSKGSVGIVDGEAVVLEAGEPNGQTLEQLIDQTLNDKPHLQAAPTTSGGGSRPAAPTPQQRDDAFAEMFGGNTYSGGFDALLKRK